MGGGTSHKNLSPPVPDNLQLFSQYKGLMNHLASFHDKFSDYWHVSVPFVLAFSSFSFSTFPLLAKRSLKLQKCSLKGGWAYLISKNL